MSIRNVKPLVIVGIVALALLAITVRYKPSVDETFQNQARPDRNRRQGLVSWFTQKLDTITINEQFVHIYDIQRGNKEANVTKPFACVDLKTSATVVAPICIYDPAVDIYVSKTIQSTSAWEKELIQMMFQILDQNPDMEFLDLGCNIGAYTVSIAKYGRRTVSVDANKNNLIFLSRSLTLGNIQDRATLIWNAIADKNEIVSLNFEAKNVGGTFVKSIKDAAAANDEQTVMAITLNNITDIFRGKNLLIKMDIQEHEWYALQGARDFFKAVNITHILMEWVLHKTLPSGGEIVKYMVEHKFSAYNPRSNPKQVLSNDNWSTWPYDVLWIKS